MPDYTEVDEKPDWQQKTVVSLRNSVVNIVGLFEHELAKGKECRYSVIGAQIFPVFPRLYWRLAERNKRF